ncbi:putative protein S-acyltransferase 12 [Gossypium australe]|uniref:Uncharacterized protein n=1 Tax=Gossypium australe TaxID=47621 RepID=A0A5B6VDC2_9ROSI|nr:putative protein S-acyltransferase 12 [Gossypium australe]
MVTIVLLPSFINFFGEAKNHSSAAKSAIMFLAFVLNFAFALSILCFVVMHASLLSSNTTSVEKGVVRWKYDLGRKKNFEQLKCWTLDYQIISKTFLPLACKKPYLLNHLVQLFHNITVQPNICPGPK